MGIAATILRRFHGGVHPEEHKNLSENCAITPLPMPKKLFVPLHQHIGAPCDINVRPGDQVKKGQQIGDPQGFVSAPVHAPTSGTITDIIDQPVGHPSGLTMMCAVLEPDGKDEWGERLTAIKDPQQTDPAELRDRIKEAGIVGLGGATFPSFIKMSPPKDKAVDLLLINGVECEPYLTCDARLMEEQGSRIVDGIHIMLRALQTDKCIIGIENNKPRAINAMREAVKDYDHITVEVLPVMYPQGGEKQLIEVVTGKQVPSGGLPIDTGVIVHNVATATSIRDAIIDGIPLISRVVTITGKGIQKPQNVETLFGTTVQSLIDFCDGFKPEVNRVVMGGPMMGVSLNTLEVPVVKGTSGILALTKEESVSRPEQACIRCASCLQACPISLMPTEMAWLARHDQLDQLLEYNLLDCIECGSCSYVCPSNIPLVHYFRYGKMEIQARDKEKKQNEIAKKRTDVKDARVEKEKAERERKKAEMKARMAAKRAAAAKAKGKPAPKADASAPAGDDKAAKAARAAKAAKAARAAKAAKAARAAKAAKAAKAAQSE
ncbi:electron transport complex subunit RsxC [Magnetococcales bacterium HHB-1]